MLENRPELAGRLDEDLVGWLTTVTASGQPQSSVVWYLRDGDDLLIYSKPDATKLANITANPNVAFNLRGDLEGDIVATFEAIATIVDDPTPAHEVAAYLNKYRGQIERLGWTPDEFGGNYSAQIRLRIDRIRAW